MTIHISEARVNEIHLVHRTMKEAFEEYRDKLTPPSGALSETEQVILDKFNNGGAVLAWEAANAVGSATYQYRDTFIYMGRISVIPAYRGKGIGKWLIEFIENLARKKNILESQIEVRLSIPSNIEFYKKLNYNIIAEHEYPEGTDRFYTMSKLL